MRIAVVCYPVCGVINFEVYLSFVIKPLFWMTKKSEQILNISITKRPFNVKWKPFSIIFKSLSVTKICLTLESAPLKGMLIKEIRLLINIISQLFYKHEIKNYYLNITKTFALELLLGFMRYTLLALLESIISNLITNKYSQEC